MRSPTISESGNDRISDGTQRESTVGRGAVVVCALVVALAFVLVAFGATGGAGAAGAAVAEDGPTGAAIDGDSVAGTAVAGAGPASASVVGEGSTSGSIVTNAEAVTFDDQTIPGETVWVTVDDVEAGDVLAVWDDADETLLGTTTVESDGSGTVFVSLDEPITGDHAILTATVHADDPDPHDPSASKYDGAVDTAAVTVVADYESVERGPVSYATASGGDEIYVETVFEEGNFSNLDPDQVSVYDRNSGEDLATNDPIVTGPDDNTVRLPLDTDEPLYPGATMQLFGTEYEIETTASTIDEDGTSDTIAGETVAIVGDENEIVTIETPSRTIERGLGEGSEVRTVETADYEPGDEITITFESDTTSSLSLADLGLQTWVDSEAWAVDAYWDDDTVEPTARTTRIDRNIEFRLLDAAGDPVDPDSFYVDRLNIDGEATAPIDLAEYDLETGVYTVEAEHVPSGATADTGDLLVVPATAEAASLDSAEYTQQAGDVLEFTVDTHGEPITHVRLDGPGIDTALTVAIESPESEAVDVAVNTYFAGHDDALAVTSQNATVDVLESPSLAEDERLPAGTYALEAGFPPTDEPDVATLDLEAPSTAGIDPRVAPAASAGDLDDDAMATIEASTKRSTLAAQDLLVLEVTVSGIFGAMVDDRGVNTEDGPTLWLTAVDGDGEETTIVPGEDPGTATAMAPGENRVYALVDEAAVDGMTAGTSWEATFERAMDDPYDATASVSTTVDVVERTLELTGSRDVDDSIEVPNVADAPVLAEASVAPGTELDFALQFPAELQQTTARVDDEGQATAFFAVDGYDDGTEIESVSVEDRVGGVEDSAAGIVVAPSIEGLEWSIDVDAPESVLVDEPATLAVTVTNEGLTVESATLEVTIDGERDVTDLELGPGDSESASYDFDTSQAGAIEWSVEIDGLGETGTLSIDDDADDGDDDGDDDGTPGFGLLVALVALLAAVMAARRRVEQVA